MASLPLNQSETGDTYLIKLDQYLQDLRKSPLNSNQQVNQIVKNVRKSLDFLRNSIDPEKISYGTIKSVDNKLDEIRAAVSILLKDYPKQLDLVMSEFDAVYQTTNQLKNNISNQTNSISNYVKNHPVRVSAILGALTGDSPLAVAFGTYLDKQKSENERKRIRHQELLKNLSTQSKSNTAVITQVPKITKNPKINQPKQPVKTISKKQPIKIVDQNTPKNPIIEAPIGQTINVPPENIIQEGLLNDGLKVSPVEELASIIDANSGKNLNN